MPRVTRPLLVGGGLYALALVAIALWPTHVDEGFDVVRGTFFGRWLLERGLTPVESYRFIELGANVLLYTPLGVLAMLLSQGIRWWQACAMALAVSATFELLQALLRPGRTADVVDIFANTLGAAIGAALFAAARSSVRRASRHRVG